MRDKIKLISSEGTGHFHTTTKNKKTMPTKMEIKKFDPVVRKHVIYKEAKIKQLFDDKRLLFAAQSHREATLDGFLLLGGYYLKTYQVFKT